MGGGGGLASTASELAGAEVVAREERHWRANTDRHKMAMLEDMEMQSSNKASEQLPYPWNAVEGVAVGAGAASCKR